MKSLFAETVIRRATSAFGSRCSKNQWKSRNSMSELRRRRNSSSSGSTCTIYNNILRCCFSTRSMDSTTTAAYDYIVVGAGSGGCVLANKLSADPKNKVLLIEAGGDDNWIWFHIPVGYLYCINNPRSDWLFQTEADPGLNGRKLIYPRGLGLGGCSLINGMLYVRGQRNDYDNWAKLVGDDSWNWDNVLPRFTAMENYYGEASEYHAKGGEWNVDAVHREWEVLDLFSEAAAEYGIPKVADFNTGDNFGVTYFDVSQTQGWRLSAYQAFIKKIKRSRPNLTILSSTLVEKLIFDEEKLGSSSSSSRCDSADTGTSPGIGSSSRCIGVVVQSKSGGSSEVIHSTKEIILTAGSIGSVQILERSGVGRPEVLHGLGIPVQCALEGVGENLQDHLQIRTVFRIDNSVPTLNTTSQTLWGKFKIALKYAMYRTGPMSAAPSQLGAFCKSSPEHDTPNIEFHVQPLSLPRFGEDLDSFNAFTASVCNIRPTSRGSVHIISKDVHTKPSIKPNYLSTAEDQQVAADSIRIARKIVSQQALSHLNPKEEKPGESLVSQEDLVKAAGDIGTTIFHPVGTCKMGAADDPYAVVDSKLRVRGIAGLRIADGSIMPTITSGNTATPIMMIASKCADIILQAGADEKKQ